MNFFSGMKRLLSGLARGGEGTTGPSQDAAENQVETCSSTTRALSIDHIRKRIISLAMSPVAMSSFCSVRAVNHDWEETAFDLIKDEDMSKFRFLLTQDEDFVTIEQFFEKVTPDAWLPLVLVFDINKLNVPLATRLVKDYSHLIVGLDLNICTSENEGVLLDLDQKMEMFHGRNLCRLKSITLHVIENLAEDDEDDDGIVDPQLFPLSEIQKGLDTLEQLTGSLTNLTDFRLHLFCDLPEEATLVLPSRLTNLSLCSRNSLQALVNPGNVLPQLRELEVFVNYPEVPLRVSVQTQLRNFLEGRTKLKQLSISTVPFLQDDPLPLLLPQLKSLREISLLGVNFVVESTTGWDVLPNLTTASLNIQLNFAEGEVAMMVALGRLLRNATYLTLDVFCATNGLPRIRSLCESFRNVTTLNFVCESGWEAISLSDVFLRMTTLHKICIRSTQTSESPVDLFRLLTGLKESEIRTAEKKTFNARRDVLTNLRQLRILEIGARCPFLSLSPLLFEAIFNVMPELTTIQLNTSDPAPEPFDTVQEMVTAWRTAGKEISYNEV